MAPADRDTRRSATQVIEHRVREGENDAFRGIVQALNAAVRRHPGFIDVEVAEPDDAQAETVGSTWRIAVRFESEETLRAWRGSSQAQRLQAQADALTIGAPTLQRANGVERWFTLPSRSNTPPPKWKTAVTSAIGIYPLLLIVPSALAPISSALPSWAGTVVNVIIMSPLITWVVMPVVTKLFQGFLYPSRT